MEILKGVVTQNHLGLEVGQKVTIELGDLNPTVRKIYVQDKLIASYDVRQLKEMETYLQRYNSCPFE